MPVNAVPLPELWLPIMVSAVLVFVASAVLWMVVQFHRNDFKRLPDEDGFRALFRGKALPPGQYAVPYCASPKEMEAPEYQARFTEGPVATIIVRKSELPKMGATLGLWFLYLLAVGVGVAYVTGRTRPAGAEYLEVFRVAGSTAMLAHCAALLPQSIWFGRPWAGILKEVFDGVVYALLTAGAFAWLWPAT